MAEWSECFSVDTVKPGECRRVLINGKHYAVYNVDGTYYSTDDACPHQGGPLGDGFLEGKCIICPWHGWAFDVVTGNCQDKPSESISTYPTRIEGCMVQVYVDS